jgi:predicted RNA-binding Zn ribbon-like protein
VNCEQCGEVIPEERIRDAVSRGQTIRYCSIACRNRAAAKRYRQKAKAAE